MGKFDEQYIKLCEKILSEGIRVSDRTGVGTLEVFGQVLRFNLAEEFPILTSKFVAWKSAILEMLWIYQAQSNDVRWLQERGIKIWDGWKADENGNYVVEAQGIDKKLGPEFAHTIGTAYGWVVREYQMVQRIIKSLKEKPQDRRMVMSLWQDAHVETATLPSCAWSTQWTVLDGRLNLTLTKRSSDVALGLPFNVTQYATLALLLAQVTGHKPGEMLVVINNAHLYLNHLDSIKEQIKIYHELGCPPAPKLWINPDIKDFFAFDNSKELKDIRLEDYKYNIKISMPVAI